MRGRFTAIHSAPKYARLFGIVRQSRLEAGEWADNDSVLVAIGKAAVREDRADGWLAEYDALFLFPAFLNEIRKPVKMVYALLDMIASRFAFKETISSVGKMNDEIAFEPITVPIVGEAASHRPGVDRQIAPAHRFKEIAAGLEIIAQGIDSEAKGGAGDGRIVKLLLWEGTHRGGASDVGVPSGDLSKDKESP